MKKFAFAIIVWASLLCCSQEQKTWVALGDSITYLNDHLDETGNRVTKGYMTRVVDTLAHISYVNKGYNGWTADVVARFIDTLAVPSADIYTVFLGTNDWWRGRALGNSDDYQRNTGNHTFFGSLRIIVDYLKKLNPHSQIILLTPMPRVDFVYLADMKNNAYGSYKEKNGQLLGDFADAIKQIGKIEKLKVIDLYNDSSMAFNNLIRFKRLKDPKTGRYKDYRYPAFISIPFNPETDDYPYPIEAVDMTYDGLHPSDKGYQVIANLLIEEMK